MLSETLKSIAAWWQRHDHPEDGAALLLAPADVAFMGGMFSDLADQAQALEHATLLHHARLVELPDGVADLAAARAARGRALAGAGGSAA